MVGVFLAAQPAGPLAPLQAILDRPPADLQSVHDVLIGDLDVGCVPGLAEEPCHEIPVARLQSGVGQKFVWAGAERERVGTLWTCGGLGAKLIAGHGRCPEQDAYVVGLVASDDRYEAPPF